MEVKLTADNNFKNLTVKPSAPEKQTTAALQRLVELYVPKNEETKGNHYDWDMHLRKIANTLDGTLSWSVKPETLNEIRYKKYEKKETARLEYLSKLPISNLTLNWRGWATFDITKIGEIDEQAAGLDQITPLLIGILQYQEIPNYALTEKMLFKHPIHKNRLFQTMRIGRNRLNGRRLPHYQDLSRLDQACNELDMLPASSNLRQLSFHPEELYSSLLELQAHEEKDEKFIEEIMLYGPRLLLRSGVNRIIETRPESRPWHELMADQMVLLANEQFNPQIITQAKIPAAAYFSFHFANPATDDKVNYVCQRTLEYNTPPGENDHFILTHNSNWYEENKSLRPILGFRQILNFRDDSWIRALIPTKNPNTATRTILSWAVNHPQSLNRNGCRNVAKLVDRLDKTYGIDFHDLLKKSPQGDQTCNWLQHLLKTDPEGPLHLFLSAALI